MVEVRLHGELATHYGKVWNLDVSSPREAVAAIEANRPGFRNKIMDLANRGMCFRVRTKNHDYDNDDIHTGLGNAERMDIVPLVMGASAGIRFVIGAVLVVAGFYSSNPLLMSAGFSLMFGSVVEWLTPIAKRNDQKKDANSWAINGPTNTTDQGMPVPIIYGEVLTGGYTISGGVSVNQLSIDGSINPTASIGGELEASMSTFELVGDPTVVVQLSVGTINLDEPYTYLWSHTGFVGASLTMSGSTSRTMRLSVTVPELALNTRESYVGTVSVAVNGYVPNTSGSTGLVAGSASASEEVWVYFDKMAPESYGD